MHSFRCYAKSGKYNMSVSTTMFFSECSFFLIFGLEKEKVTDYDLS